MEKYLVKETTSEPRVELDAQKNLLHFEGESRPEDVTNFYAPILKWVEEYGDYLKSSSSSNVEVQCVFNLDYFNSASSKSILDVIESLAGISEELPECNIKILWYYDSMDEDMKEAGEEFQMISQLEFEFHEAE